MSGLFDHWDAPGVEPAPCVFCGIAQGTVPANIVYEDAVTVAFIDQRQFHPGHTLVIPRQHLADVRELDERTGAALMATIAKVTAAVGKAFPNEGISLWNSIGPAAFQEVPHLHFHVHPRRTDDDLLSVYPGEPPITEESQREEYAATLRRFL